MVKDITIVSLSRGLLGMPYVKHELDIGLKRLESYGINVHFADHALCNQTFLFEHPELRAQDLLTVLNSDTDMILCAVGGDDTYRLLPYLFDHDELKKAACNKIFLGFSDTTINHFMLHKVGMKTFYGQAFLPDVCELSPEMFSYTKYYFEELINTGKISSVQPADDWFGARTDFSISAIGSTPDSHENTGFELVQGPSSFSGEILGGCIDSIFDIFNNERYEDTVSMCSKYELFPTVDDWRGKILLTETSEELPTPEKYRRMVRALKQTGIFDVISGILIGKPVNELYFDEYKKIMVEEVGCSELPIVANVNVGHATPRCIIPFGVNAHVDIEKQIITFDN